MRKGDISERQKLPSRNVRSRTVYFRNLKRVLVRDEHCVLRKDEKERKRSDPNYASASGGEITLNAL